MSELAGIHADAPAMDIAPHGMELAEATAVYTAFRGYLVHEDDLVHQRTTWSIAIQTFAVATFGIIFQRTMDTITALGAPSPPVDLLDLVRDRYRFLLWLVAGFGLGVSLISGIAVFAAQTAISRLQHVWNEKHFNVDDICKKFPPLTGGGSRLAVNLGHCLPLALPVFFVLFWAFASIYVYYAV